MRATVAALSVIFSTLSAGATDLGYFNITAYGATGCPADDTAAINAALAAERAAGHGVVFLPAGVWCSSGGHDLSGAPSLRILGAGIGATTIKITSPSNDLFLSTLETRDLTIEDFSVTSDPGVRTGGWVVHAGGAYTSGGYLRRSYIKSLDIKKQVNGLWIAQYELVGIDKLMMTDFLGGTGVAIKAGQTAATNVNQGAGLTITATKIYGQDFVGSDPPALGYGLWIEDADAVEANNLEIGATLTNNVRIVGNKHGHGSSNHFFHQLISDATGSSHGVYITGDGLVELVKFTGCWFSSAGMLFSGGTSGANGLRIDVANIALMEITGSNFFNNNGTGFYVSNLPSGSGASIAFSGNTLAGNGQGRQAGNCDGIYLNIAVNAIGPVMTGNDDTGETCVSIRTGSTTNRISLVGNRFVSGGSFGIAPMISGLNEGI